MNEKKMGLKFLKNKALHILCILLIFLAAIAMLWYSNANSVQAESALMAQVYFDGEYRVGDGEWQKIMEGEHIPSTKGDVTLRGNFHLLTPDGEYVGIGGAEIPIALYTNHINVTITESGAEPFVIDIENSLFGDSTCAADWTAYVLMSDAPLEILIHNPHSFGNENAIDELLSKTEIWANIDFENGVLNSGSVQRNAGFLFIIVSLIFLGTALFSTLIHVKNSGIIWLLGLVVLSAGAYFTYSADGVSFWSKSIVTNTAMLGFSMIFYMLFVSIGILFFLKRTKVLGTVVVVVLGIADVTFFVLPILSDVKFYDTWLFWAVIQCVACIVLFACLIREFFAADGNNRGLCLGALLPLVAFCVDVVVTWLGYWEGGLVSKFAFIILFAAAMIVVLRIIPGSINATAKAKELEIQTTVLNAELAESRVSTMMSQIRPHFIYNALGSIEQLCKIDPAKAGELVHSFAKYLRGNFGELDNPKPIRMSQEMEHVRYYISIENVRFPDMTFSFEMNSIDFDIPALTIQPIVENAIKHGLMKLQKGGTICVVSYETDTHYCVSVEDDGVGFDTSVLLDEREHVGIRNIRGRLKAMVGGTLEIESTVGVGTMVLIKIPKEEQK